MRILHLADLHLDTPFASLSSEQRSRLQEGAREALRRGVDLALTEGVHAVLLAGDLFDGATLSYRTELFLVREMERLAQAGVTVVYVTGNHDPGGSTARRIAWPENVCVFDGPGPRTVEIRGRDGGLLGTVTGAGHASQRVTDNLAATFPRPTGPGAHVAVLHTQVLGSRGSEGHHPYAPAELGTLTRSGHHYWALGHIHQRQELSSHPAVHYPGSLQGRNPRETGAKGGLLADLGNPTDPKVTFHPLAPVRWERLDVPFLQDVETAEALLRRVAGTWQEARGRDPGEVGTSWMVRVALLGPSPLWNELRQQERRAELDALLAEELDLLGAEILSDGVTSPRSIEEHRGRRDVLGESLRLLERLLSGEEPIPADWLGELATVAVLGERESEEAAREMLQGGAEELLQRLLQEEPR